MPLLNSQKKGPLGAYYRLKASREKAEQEEADKKAGVGSSPEARAVRDAKEAEELRKIRAEKRAREAGTNAPPVLEKPGTNAPPAVKPLSKLDEAEKSEMVALARVVNSAPEADAFWSDVETELDRLGGEKELVKSRET